MTSASEAHRSTQFRSYDREKSIVFLKTNERFGGLSNMAPGFPLRVNGVHIRTSEALYQACRFPHMPDVQRQIVDERSPMTAKMRSKPFRKRSRPDWDAVRVKIMRWCLRVKLAQNWREFGRLLLATGERPIVEQSRKDDFWGAKVTADGTLVGMNVLGRLLMELREQLKGDEAESLRSIEPLAIPEFFLFERPIEPILAPSDAEIPGWNDRRPSQPVAASPQSETPQPLQFDRPMLAASNPEPTAVCCEALHTHREPKQFSNYRDSGLPWLGPIPRQWEVRRNGRLFAQRNDTGHEDLPILEVSLRTGVRVRDLDNGARKQTMADRSKYKRAAKGDVAYNMMRMWQGAVGVAPVDGLVSPAYVVARPFPEVEPRYYGYLFRTGDYMREVNKFSRGIVSDRNRLYWDDFKRMPSVFPPTDEQTRIADFLDAHGRLTARLIRSKRRLMALLNEQKQAIINRAVTRGLDPHAPLKPTGIDWMPEVPAHWELKKFKYFARFLSGGTPPMSQGQYWTAEIPWVSPKDMKMARIRSAQMSISEKAIQDGHSPLLQPGNLMMVVRSGILRRSIPIAICDAPVAINQDIKGIVLDEAVVSPTYFHLMVTGLEGDLLLAWRKQGATVESLEYQLFANSYLPLPTLDEQHEIEIWCSEETAIFNHAVEEAKKVIALINEYRERLIADVVTGKLDVRYIEIAAPADEPVGDETEGLEPDEEPVDEETEPDEAED